MDFEELALMAYREDKLNEYASLPEKYIYYKLQELYLNYKTGKINKEKSIQEKNRLRKEYIYESNKMKQSLEISKEYNKNKIENSSLLFELEKAKDKEEVLKACLKLIQNVFNDNSIYERLCKKHKLN